MSTEQNKTLVRRLFEEIVNQKKLDMVRELVGANYVNHNMPAPQSGPEGLKQVLGPFFAAFPDMHVTLEQVIAEGDRVSTCGVMRGTHKGDFMGIPATGKQITISYIDIWRVENNKLVENWVQLDMLGLMQQLGVIPAPEQARG
jgi:steroid delta-isomerase-like uncharacterized protein